MANEIKNRIKELRQVKASELLTNPRNWRRHPVGQAEALRGALTEIGYADALIAYETPEGLMLIDGHLRAETTPDMEVPVLVTDLDEEEANKLLMTLDPLSAMASADTDIFDTLRQITTVENDALQEMLGAITDGNLMSLEAMPHHVDGADGLLWQPKEDTSSGEHATDLVGYDLGSVWMRGGDADSTVFPYLLPLPANPDKAKMGALTANYSRSPAREMTWIVKTYMRPGDYFLEVCAGWFTFSSTAAMHGYNGEGVDIWDESLRFGRRQLKHLPDGVGSVRVVQGNATALEYPDAHFDFVYCNPPFFQLERYGDSPDDLGAKPTIEEWLKASGLMMQEMLRVAKPGAIIVTVMADYRANGLLIPLHLEWISEAQRHGLLLHDIVIQHLLSQQLRFWRHAYKAKRTAKAHEYVIVFKKPGGGDPDGLSPSPDDEAPLEEIDADLD
jgi:ubiquinone/menaquinone biosynthesis C-methylase UbiE